MTIDAARTARDELAAAAETNHPQIGEYARTYFRSLEQLFSLYSSPQKNWFGDVPLKHLPADITLIVSKLFGTLAVGNIPDPIADCAKKGRTKPGPSERRDVEIAVAYVKAAKSGMLNDRAPIANVAASYDVHRRTVQGWQASHPDIDPVAVAHGHPEFLERLMKGAGKRYRHAGRSRSAIASCGPTRG